MICIYKMKGVFNSSAMKRFSVIAVCLAFLFCGCEQITPEERIYTEGELNMIVEWTRCGWDEVINETGAAVTLTAVYPPFCFPHDSLSFVIHKADMLKLDIGGCLPMCSISESMAVTIELGDGRKFVCNRPGDDAWSIRFWNFQQRDTFEVVQIGDKKVRHDMVARTFHIDQELIDCWRTGRSE